MKTRREVVGERADFPETSWSVIRRARGEGVARASLEELASLYWRPIYWFIRARWRRSDEDAKDLTQEFFIVLLERDTLRQLRSEKIRFRAFLRACLENFLLSERRDRKRIKRGGKATIVPLEEVELAPPSPALTPEEVFDRAWAHSVLEDSVASLREIYVTSGRELWWRLFEAYHLSATETSYEACAAAHGVAVHDVHNRLRHARRLLQGLVRERVRDTLDDPADLESELAFLERLA
ncbi:MAG TPA: sigma-70 family RNA polymerase sigma factor [Planctomycetota bacterium]|nr:sigma-70 family RNA polymerase sigma factor [Planctomycetota bacterium]